MVIGFFAQYSKFELAILPIQNAPSLYATRFAFDSLRYSTYFPFVAKSYVPYIEACSSVNAAASSTVRNSGRDELAQSLSMLA